MSRDQAPGRRREYTAAEARRWAAAIADGLSRPEFRARFSLSVEAARGHAERLGVTIPLIDRSGDVQQAKAPPVSPERSVLWFPTPRSRRKAGATRRRMS